MNFKLMFVTLLATVSLGFPVLAQSDGATGESLKGQSGQITITLHPDPANTSHPRMGDRLKFVSTITNTGTDPIKGVVAWVSLIQVDANKEQPVDLEDWSAHKAEVAASLAPGQSMVSTWPMRLIKDGNYRVVVSAASGGAAGLTASPMLALAIAPKPVVESVRVIPIAAGVPFILLGLLLFRRRRSALA